MYWLQDGDLNTKFFHRTATVLRNSQKIKMLMNEVSLEVRDQAELCEVAKRYFEGLFTATTGSYAPVLNMVQPVISEADNRLFTTHILKEELYEALSQMH